MSDVLSQRLEQALEILKDFENLVPAGTFKTLETKLEKLKEEESEDYKKTADLAEYMCNYAGDTDTWSSLWEYEREEFLEYSRGALTWMKINHYEQEVAYSVEVKPGNPLNVKAGLNQTDANNELVRGRYDW